MEDFSQYFEDTNVSNKVQCKVCKKILNSSRKFNLKTHLKQVHNIETIKINKQIRKNEKTKTIKAKVEISKTEVIRSFIGLITENGMPFDVLNSANMRNLLKPISDVFNYNETKFTFSSENAKKVLSNVVSKVRDDIKTELKNKLFSIKIDSATRLERCIFGISVQYCKELKIISRVIGMIELKGKGSSRSKNLCGEILKTLSKYELNISQVISITSDNGANMIKTTSMLSQCLSRNNDEETALTNEEYEKLLDEIATDSDLTLGDINICRCAAHTAQLVAVDVIKKESINDFITKCRNIVKYIRKPTNGIRALFEFNKFHIPQIDCPTRWGSSYRMIYDIKESRSIMESTENTSLEIDELFWERVNSFLLAFAPLNEIIIKYQSESLNYSDFYAYWLKCKLLIQKNINQSSDNSFLKIVSISLMESIEKRSEKLLNNDILKACMYLDPRFQQTLSLEEKEVATTYLKKIWDKYISFNNYNNLQESDVTQNINDEDDILTIFLKQGIPEEQEVVTNVYSKIESIKLPFLKSTINVMEYWQDRKSTYPELYIISNIIFGVPPTQVTVERAFSALKIILTDTRNRLSEENLENILLAKLNHDLLDVAIEDTII